MIRNCLLLAVVAGLSASAATINATAPQPSYTPGATIPVNVTVSNVTDLYAFQVELAFNPAVLSAQSVTEGSYFATNGVEFGPVDIDNTAGTVSYIADSLSGSVSGFTGSALLATVDFKATGQGASNLTPEDAILVDSNLNSITATVSASTVDIVATPEPAYGVAAGMLLASILLLRRRRLA